MPGVSYHFDFTRWNFFSKSIRLFSARQNIIVRSDQHDNVALQVLQLVANPFRPLLQVKLQSVPHSVFGEDGKKRVESPGRVLHQVGDSSCNVTSQQGLRQRLQSVPSPLQQVPSRLHIQRPSKEQGGAEGGIGEAPERLVEQRRASQLTQQAVAERRDELGKLEVLERESCRQLGDQLAGERPVGAEEGGGGVCEDKPRYCSLFFLL
mmetsp:Transcript_40401/g.127175  ORF Transcript_40401/g.127175 Transcript_40401/m.127175 type:complete len:208 (-) Transcript_40401:667-1290(-)